MSFLDRAKDMLDQHDEKVDDALGKVGEFAKGKFAGHDTQIDGMIDKAQEMTGAGDTTRTAEGPVADGERPPVAVPPTRP